MEFPELGKRCGEENCGQLDFLPAECVHCRTQFCKDHLSPFVHKCSHFEDKVLTDQDLAEKEKIRWQIKCSQSTCNVKDLVPMKCSRCKEHFCLSHRHADQHKCVTTEEDVKKARAVSEASARAKSSIEFQNKIKEDINNKLAEAKAGGGCKGAMATKLALMRLKGRAKGENSVPQADRIYFIVDCPNKGQNPKPLDVFMSSKWTLGKAIDFMAKQARIKNRNNQADAPKLHIYKGEVCLSIPSDKTITDLVNDGLIVDGDEIEMKLVDP